MNHLRFARPMRHAQAGIGMIEVLITLLVISFGFLAIAALQARALSTNNSASTRSAATLATYSILDALRADEDNAKALRYNGVVSADQCPAADPANLPQTQVATWCNQLGQAFGATASTTGSINCSAVGNCTITIQFDDSRAGADAASSSAQQVVTKAQL